MVIIPPGISRNFPASLSALVFRGWLSVFQVLWAIVREAEDEDRSAFREDFPRVGTTLTSALVTQVTHLAGSARVQPALIDLKVWRPIRGGHTHKGKTQAAGLSFNRFLERHTLGLTALSHQPVLEKKNPKH
jgi:hypothetical protein